MRIWIDLANSPHVPFFRALTRRFDELGHHYGITARDFAETVPLAHAAGLSSEIIGRHGGKSYSGKATNLLSRARALSAWARQRKFDLAVSHNSYSQIVAAKWLGLKTVTLMDYEHQPANHLAFRLSSRVIVPQSFPESQLRHFGAKAAKVSRYAGTKEDVYLADFTPIPNFRSHLCKLGIKPDNVLVLMRPPAGAALYHRFENTLFDRSIEILSKRSDIQVLLLPRSEEQRRFYANQANENILLLKEPLDGANLIAASDFVISAGGTMNREAAALGVPAASVYAGRWAAVDDALLKEGRLLRLSSAADVENLPIRKRSGMHQRGATTVRDEVARLILE